MRRDCMQQPQACADRGPADPAHGVATVERDAAMPVPGGASQLFRPDALAERQTQWLGTVLLAPRASHRFFAVFAAFAAAAILALLLFADFTRKARIGGWLLPHEGLVRVVAPRPGVVTGLHVREGTEVRKGDRLLTLSAELQSATLGATQAEITRRLGVRRDILIEERRKHELLLAQQQRSLADRLAALDSEHAQLKREIAIQRFRLTLAEKAETRQRSLRAQGYISEQALQQAQGARLEQGARLGALERSLISMARERLTLESELKDMPLKAQTEIAAIDRNIAAVEQELAEAEARREIIIPAPQDGTVTAILAELGGHASASVPLLSIVPAGARLEAHLYSPSRAVGFVRPGQRVLLRYQAYPYQKFGHYEGLVASVSRSAVSPGELPPQLAGLTNMYGANEPVYRITVSLASQTVTAYGEKVPLQPGMQLEADIALEKRRLVEWVLDPLYTLTGKWHG